MEFNRDEWCRKAITAVRGGDPSASAALSAFGIREGWRWAERHIVQPLLETLGVWQFGGVTDDVAFSVLELIRKILKSYCQNDLKAVKQKSEALTRLKGVLFSGKGTLHQTYIYLVSPYVVTNF